MAFRTDTGNIDASYVRDTSGDVIDPAQGLTLTAKPGNFREWRWFHNENQSKCQPGASRDYLSRKSIPFVGAVRALSALKETVTPVAPLTATAVSGFKMFE